MRKGRGVAVAALLLASAGAAEAQSVRGVVVEQLSGRPIPEAIVTLLGGSGAVAGRVQAGADGTFGFDVRAGGYRLQAERLGYQPVASGELALREGDTTRVLLRMSTRTVVLDPLTVVSAPRTLRERTLADFEYRRRRGWGSYLTPEQIERVRGFPASTIVQQLPRVTLDYGALRPRILLPDRRMSGSKCEAAIFVDGVRIRVDDDVTVDDFVPGARVMAVEVYYRPHTTPPEFATFDNTCGTVVIWTER